MGKIWLLTLALSLSLFSAPAFAEGSLTIVASERQITDMQTMLADLADNDVKVEFVDPEKIISATQADHLFIVAAGKNPTSAFIAKKLPSSVTERLGEQGYGKYILLRDTWKEGQEVVVLIGSDDEAVSKVRKKTWASWWSTVASWFDINVLLVKPY